MRNALPNALRPTQCKRNAAMQSTNERTDELTENLLSPTRKKLTQSNAREPQQKIINPPRDPAQQAVALTITCTYCNAPIGQPCTNKQTGEPLQNFDAHICRIAKAEKPPF